MIMIIEDEVEPRYDMEALCMSALALNGGVKEGEHIDLWSLTIHDWSLISHLSDSSLIEKVISVLSTLCVEGEELVDEAAHRILPPLLLYGEDEHTEG